MPFNFQPILTPRDVLTARKVVDDYEKSLPKAGWPNWVLGNQDQHRIATRVGPAQERVANMLLLRMPGTPTCHHDDEIDMQNIPIPPEIVPDPPADNQSAIVHIIGRDPERTPMLWNDSPSAGFTDPGIKIWLPVMLDYAQLSIALQSTHSDFMLVFIQSLSRLRQSQVSLAVGEYASVDLENDAVFAYTSFTNGSDALFIVLNFGDGAHTIDLSGIAESASVALCTSMDRYADVDLNTFSIAANEGAYCGLTW